MATSTFKAFLVLCTLTLTSVQASDVTSTVPLVDLSGNCAAETAQVPFNDPKAITALGIPWSEPFGNVVPTVDQLYGHPDVGKRVNWKVFAPMTVENALRAYPGFKIYRFPNEGLQFQFNYYRGALTRTHFAQALLGKKLGRGYNTKTHQFEVSPVDSGNLLKHMFNQTYQLKGEAEGKHKTAPRLTDKPAYEIRFNNDVKALLKAAGEAERIDYDPATKFAKVDENGKTVLTTDTWFTPEVQEVILQMIERGEAYTIGVYTTEHHPAVMENNDVVATSTRFNSALLHTKPGGDPTITNDMLVGGLVAVHVNGVSTGLTLFMNRRPLVKKIITDKEKGTFEMRETSELLFDGVGRMAFLAQVLESWRQGAIMVDTVAVNDAAQRLGSEYYERPAYLELVKEQAKNPFKFVPPKGLYRIPFEQLTEDRLYEMAGMEKEVPQPKFEPLTMERIQAIVTNDRMNDGVDFPQDFLESLVGLSKKHAKSKIADKRQEIQRALQKQSETAGQ